MTSCDGHIVCTRRGESENEPFRSVQDTMMQLVRVPSLLEVEQQHQALVRQLVKMYPRLAEVRVEPALRF